MAGVDFRGLRPKNGLAKTVALGKGGGRCGGLRGRGFWRNSGGRFSAREGRWRLYNRGWRVLLRSRSLQQTLDPKGDAYCGSWESYYVNPKMSVCVCVQKR